MNRNQLCGLLLGSQLLRAVSPRPQTEKNLGMMPLTGGNIHKTSSCPVLPGRQGDEHWPYPIFQLVLTNLHLLPLGAQLKCED